MLCVTNKMLFYNYRTKPVTFVSFFRTALPMSIQQNRKWVQRLPGV